jgi:choline monooxygenase
MSHPIREIVDAYNPATSLPRASTPPRAWYVDPEILELEYRTVFADSWQMVGSIDQVREPGQFLTFQIAREPLLLVRGGDGILRGFFNVCRHHAAAVMTAACGKAEHLRCPYHGWTYDLQGALIQTPEFGGVEDFDRSKNGLVPIQTAQWGPWLFAKLASTGTSLIDQLGRDLIGQLEALHLEQFRWLERRRYLINCNWKVFVDNYLDGGYHVPHIHAGLSSVLVAGKYAIETGERYCLQSSPISADRAESQIAGARTGEQAFYYWLYPNFMINMYQGVMDTNLVVPLAVDRTEVIFDYYFADVSPAGRQLNFTSIAVSEQIQAEDAAICESVQRGLSSRAYDTGRLSVRRERGEHLFHQLLHADLKAGTSQK